MRCHLRKLLDQVRHIIRLKHYSLSTENTCFSWVERYILFHNKRHSQEIGVPEIEAFLTRLAIDQQVAASTQNQALHALLFLYQEVSCEELDCPISSMRAKRSRHLPTVLAREELTAEERQLVMKVEAGTLEELAEVLSSAA
jgi:hypothetical protein